MRTYVVTGDTITESEVPAAILARRYFAALALQAKPTPADTRAESGDQS